MTVSGPVVLVGAPSSGKSTVGRLLAERLGWTFLDVDTLIEEQAGKPISEIFAVDGEPAFREQETATTLRVLGSGEQQQVISLGGGAVTSEPIRRALRQVPVVWLQVGIAAAADRIGLNTSRPLLLGNVRSRLITLMRQREPLYAEVADHRLSTDDTDPAELAAEVTRLLAPPG